MFKRVVHSSELATWQGLGLMLLGTLALMEPVAAQYSIHNCGGVITDRPCDQVGKERPSVSRATSDESSQAKQARFLFNDFDLARLDAKRQYDVDVSPASARDLCLGSGADLERCRTEITKLNERLDGLVMHAKELEATSRQEDDGEEDESSQVIVVNNNDDDLCTRYPYRCGNNGRDKLYLPPESETKFLSPTERDQRLNQKLDEMNRPPALPPQVVPHRGRR